MLFVGKGLMGDNWAMEIHHPDSEEYAFLVSERKKYRGKQKKPPTYDFRVITAYFKDGDADVQKSYGSWFIPG
jgi:hypothetical protein